MKKILCTVLVVLLTVVMFAGCGKTEATKNAEKLIQVSQNGSTFKETLSSNSFVFFFNVS